jgi:uncharacterized cysteine cluster protein YcgN (CxxCxxCC family)
MTWQKTTIIEEGHHKLAYQCVHCGHTGLATNIDPNCGHTCEEQLTAIKIVPPDKPYKPRKKRKKLVKWGRATP